MRDLQFRSVSLQLPRPEIDAARRGIASSRVLAYKVHRAGETRATVSAD